MKVGCYMRRIGTTSDGYGMLCECLNKKLFLKIFDMSTLHIASARVSGCVVVRGMLLLDDRIGQPS